MIFQKFMPGEKVQFAYLPNDAEDDASNAERAQAHARANEPI